MAMNLEAVLRIAAKVVGVEEISKLEKGITGAEKAAGSASAAFKGVANSAIWQAAAAGAAVFTAGIGLAVGAAMRFETSMADVRRVVSGIETPEAFAEISAEILNLSNQMPIAADGFAQIYAAAGQSGIARDEIKEFAVAVAQTAVAFDMTAEQAGTAMATMRSALGLTTPELINLTGAINELSNQSQGALNAGQLVEFTTRVGAIGSIAGFSGEEMAAFGAVMMQNGQQAEVASTGFRNLVSALSKGPAMTDKQVDALRRLGYSMADAKQIESELTRAAETESRRRVDDARRHKDEIVRTAQEQSDRRIEIARDETDRLSKEINRRYRDELTALQDGWEDQAKAQEDAFRDRADAQIKALQRQERAEIDSIQKVAQAQGGDASAAVDRIRDAYESRIDAIRDQLDRELTVQRRAQRNQQQAVRDGLDDRRDLELKANADRLKLVEQNEEAFVDAQKAAAENRFKATEESEKSFMEASKAAAKKTGEERAKADLLGFAERFTKDAKNVTAEVLQKLQQLPREELYSTLVDLGGEEMARSVATLVQNFDQLESRMRIATNTAVNANSVAKEYGVRAATAASQVQMFWNQLTSLGVVIGTTILPYLAQATEALRPFLSGLAQFATANPGIVAVAVAIGGIASAIVIALPVIAGLIVSIGTIKTALAGLAIGATVAGWLGAVVPALGTLLGAFKFAFVSGLIPLLQGVITWIGATFIPALLAFFSGPVGWTVLAVAAVVAMAVAFREPIMGFFSWLGGAIGNGLQALWQWGEPIRQFWIGVWEAVKAPATAYFQFLGGVATWGLNAVMAIAETLLVRPWVLLWNKVLRDPASAAFRWLTSTVSSGFKAVTTAIDNLFVKPWVLIWNKGIREPVTAAQEWLRSSVFIPLGRAFVTYVADPITNAWRAVTEFLPRAMQSVATFVSGIWNGMITGIQNAVRGMLTFVVNAVNRVGGLVNVLIDAFNRLAFAVGGSTIDRIPTLSVPAFAEGGIVDRPTLALVGERREQEYIIPESKMQAASSRFLGGARGADVIPSRASSRSESGSAAPQINVTTGPVMQQQDGSQWVSMDDFERGMQQVAEQVVGALRTPQARVALGW